LPHEVVKRRPEVVDAVSEDDAKANRWVLADLEPLNPFPRITIEFTNGGIGLRFPVGEGVDLIKEFVELLLARLNFSMAPAKRCGDEFAPDTVPARLSAMPRSG